jgi:arylsulfatase A-like enzyme
MKKSKPNVIFICVDDLRPELGCYGCEHVITPNIDRLAAMGCYFDRSYVQVSLCNPSRASMLTGKRPDDLSVWGLDNHFRDEQPKVVTLPQHFKQQGYHTAAIGKIYHNNKPDPKSWSEPHICIPGYPYDPDAVYRDDGNIHYLEQRKKDILQQGDETKHIDEFGQWYLKACATEMPDVADDAYYDGAQTDVAMQKIDELNAAQQPFFFGIGYYRPHLPFNVPKRYWDMYDRENIALAEFDMPPLGAPPMALNNLRELRGYTDFNATEHPNKSQLNPDDARLLRHGYFASVTYIDTQIGKILDHLEELGILDDTVIVMWGDNGWKLGDYGSWCKMTNYEMDTRVPLIIKPSQSKIADSRRDQIVESVDIYPTLCELAGLELPNGLAGKSLLAQINDPHCKGKTHAFSQFLRHGIWGAPNGRETMGYTVRTANWRYVEWFYSDSTELIAKELYDIATQGLETINLCGQADYQAMEKALAQLLTDYRGNTLPLKTSQYR